MKRDAIISVAMILILLTAICTFNTTLSSAITKQETEYERVIAHGGGAFQGYETTNSVEAIKKAIENGYKLIELDMEFSSDDKIIMLHDWDKTIVHYLGTSYERKISESQFLNLSIHGRFEVLTFEKLVKILDKTPDLKIVTDTKGDNQKLLSKIAVDYPKYVGRMIPQIYDYDELEWVKDLGFTDIIFTLYTQPHLDLDIEKIITFVKENDIYAVAMPDYFAEKGMCKKLADSGIIVYIHPVATLEKAINYNNQGAYGVYSGVLLPEEFTGIEKDYYLVTDLVADNVSKNGEADNIKLTEKLTDQPIKSLEDLKMKGLKAGEYVKYFIEEEGRQSFITNEDIFALEKGKHKLIAVIYHNSGLPLGELEYILWKEEERLRILHKKYEYRLDGFKEAKVFNTVMEANIETKEMKELLEKSFIAKKTEYWYYNNGMVGSFMNGNELLPVQKSTNGKLLLPLGTTAIELGATSVTMEKGKDMVVTYGNEKIRAVINSYSIRNGFRVRWLKTPISLYLNKAMASGEIYEHITGRTYIEKDNLIIILPENIKVNQNTVNRLIETAQDLF